jgi:NhaA family Na+:H+ antiporter
MPSDLSGIPVLKPLVPKVIADSSNDFLELESSSGILLIIAAILAMIVANSPLAPLYASLIELPVGLRVGAFAFANAGISLAGLSVDSFLHTLPLGIMSGLFLGKQLGVFLFCALGALLGIARLPAGLRWAHIHGTSLICGVGFTMSLFIGSLAFEETGVNLLFDERIGIIAGSLVSGVCGYLVLRVTLPESADS